MTDYSQSGEQATILQLAASLPVGRFLDIGAGDGVTFSNTRALAEAGWGGVAVEPAAWAFEKLLALYADEERSVFAADHSAVVCVQACVTGDPEGLQPFHYAPGDHLSTTVESEARKWPAVRFWRSFAASVALSDLLDHLGVGVTVVSIDAEGRTGELVEAFMRHPAWAGVRVLCHEHVPYSRRLPRLASAAALQQQLLDDGLELVATTPNNLIWWQP